MIILLLVLGLCSQVAPRASVDVAEIASSAQSPRGADVTGSPQAAPATPGAQVEKVARSGVAPGAVVEGRGGPTVTIPRVEAEITVDGRLDEPVWSQAVRLTGFWQYRPVDSRPATEQTEVLVWYSPTALHFGIVAHDREPGSIRATVADRDNLSRDDTVTIYLDTFNDQRRAFFFTVNPLGVQEDGVQSESGFNAGTSHGQGDWAASGGMNGTTDLSPDYLFDSKGQLTPDGYVVEVRIPFKSLRYDGTGPQRWGLNIRRRIQRTGYEETWTDAKRISSFLAQSGAVDGLHDMKRGVVTELQPVITASNDGALDTSGNFTRGSTDWNPGFNAHFGFTNLAIDGTIKPDFSQVESDAGLVTVNERFALFYPEKRPFFLEGIELFATPNQLVYTRQIAAPYGGGKLTGKIGKTTIAYLMADDDLGVTDPGVPHAALFNIARIRRDLGASSTAGVTYTDRTTSAGYNRVFAADSRIVFKKLYYVQGQIGGAWTDPGTGNVAASPIWLAEFDRTAPRWGFNYRLTGIGRNFESQSGYVPRNDIVNAHGSNRFTWYGKRGATLETFTTMQGFSRISPYGPFFTQAPIEGDENVNFMAQLRGGWTMSTELQAAFARFDLGHYGGYMVPGPDGALVPYDPPTKATGLGQYSFSFTTPTFRKVNAGLSVSRGEVPIYDEASEGLEMLWSANANVRPSEQIRIEFTAVLSTIDRTRDGSEFARTLIPRLKVEYQPRRSLFFRVVGEYRSQRQDGLEDARTGLPIYIGGVPSSPAQFGNLRVDYLISYKPSPGTVAFFGYGSTLDSPLTDRLSDVRRISDGFFVKLAYLFRH